MRAVISHMIMVHELPFSFVEYELFNIVMQSASPYYERIGRTATTKDCWSTYELEKKRVQELLNLVDKISITTDIWTSNQNIQYMVITAHFMDMDSKLQKRVINFVEVLPPHTGTCVCDAIYKCLQGWGIEEKVWTITVDNASYNESAVRLLHDSLSFHTTLPLEDGLSEIKSIIENVRDSVKWNVTFAMLSCALDFKQVFPRYQLRDPNYKCLPSEDDWQRVEEICSLLVHFNEVTKIISGSEYPTANSFLPELYSIKEILGQKSKSVEPWMKNMGQRMQHKFDKYWGSSNLLLSIAAALDPRNKMTFIQFVFPVIYSEKEATTQICIVHDAFFKPINGK
ncbi:PREDICTED: zinc finger BED domain-containing protein DAYSLEEPER-like [Ipomoea nil]|uniref:zinc finger BED domain-containing protein DAYSLEEPER-like n=1 Tax=Ipomoea nil TaxID=35883 RepID=UPI000900E7A1|nr:PREDICTED: zinc finger BED domain-containing protein DAYSLEEPER-like [Ipomoea nil]